MKLKLLLLLFLLNGTLLYAQEEPELEEEEEEIVEEEFEEEFNEDYVPRFCVGMEFNIGIPLNNFNDNIDGLGFGFGGNFLVRTNPNADVPVLAGISGGINIYDRERRNQLILIDGVTVDGRLTTRNSIFLGHGVLRVLPPVNVRIQPYIDGMFGLKNLYTRTTIEEIIEFEENEVIESYIENGDWAFSYGGALGIQAMIVGHEGVFILFDIRCAYLKGNAATYLVRSDDPNIQIFDPIDAFEERNSTTDMLIPQIGVSFVF